MSNNGKPYHKECNRCKKQILMSCNSSGNWKAFELNSDKIHECGKVQNENNHKEITLDMVMKKLSAIGINVDLSKLLKESDYIQ